MFTWKNDALQLLVIRWTENINMYRFVRYLGSNESFITMLYIVIGWGQKRRNYNGKYKYSYYLPKRKNYMKKKHSHM